MANSVVIAFSGSDFSTSTVMGVFTREIGMQPEVWSQDGNGHLLTETLPVGGEMHPDLSRALVLSEQTQNHYGVSPCGLIKVLTQTEFATLPQWAAQVAWVSDVNPV